MVELSMVFLGILVFGGLAYAAYLGMKAEQEHEKKRQLAIKSRLNTAKIGLLDGRHDEFLIHCQVALMDTRRSDGRDVLKIIDFGLAEKFARNQKTSNIACGTPLFSAPEILSQQQFDFRVDVWSAGVMFYHMLTGESPFMARSMDELKAKVCTGNPPPKANELRNT